MPLAYIVDILPLAGQKPKMKMAPPCRPWRVTRAGTIRLTGMGRNG